MTVFVAPGPIEVKARIGSPRGAGVAVGQVDGGLLVHDLHAVDRIGPVEEGVGQRPAAVARNAGHARGRPG